jgi:hypothetical protein
MTVQCPPGRVRGIRPYASPDGRRSDEHPGQASELARLHACPRPRVPGARGWGRLGAHVRGLTGRPGRWFHYSIQPSMARSCVFYFPFPFIPLAFSLHEQRTEKRVCASLLVITYSSWIRPVRNGKGSWHLQGMAIPAVSCRQCSCYYYY